MWLLFRISSSPYCIEGHYFLKRVKISWAGFDLLILIILLSNHGWRTLKWFCRFFDVWTVSVSYKFQCKNRREGWNFCYWVSWKEELINWNMNTEKNYWIYWKNEVGTLNIIKVLIKDNFYRGIQLYEKKVEPLSVIESLIWWKVFAASKHTPPFLFIARLASQTIL